MMRCTICGENANDGYHGISKRDGDLCNGCVKEVLKIAFMGLETAIQKGIRRWIDNAEIERELLVRGEHV